MKFKNYINELFDSDIKVGYNMLGKDFYGFFFTVNGKEYSPEIFKVFDTDWIISFFDENSSEEITGGGGKDVFKIFAGVIKCIKIVIKKENPEQISFSAKEPSRRKLYDKFAKLFVKTTNYKSFKSKEFSDDKSYIFKRI